MGFGDVWSNTDRRSDEICWDLILNDTYLLAPENRRAYVANSWVDNA